jgi:hypothetical protein
MAPKFEWRLVVNTSNREVIDLESHLVGVYQLFMGHLLPLAGETGRGQSPAPHIGADPAAF